MKMDLPATEVMPILDKAVPMSELREEASAVAQTVLAYTSPERFPKNVLLEEMANVRGAKQGARFALRYLPFGLKQKKSSWNQQRKSCLSGFSRQSQSAPCRNPVSRIRRIHTP